MATITVSGIVGSAILLTSGDVVDVVAGGTVLDTALTTDILLTVSSGGYASGITIAADQLSAEAGSESIVAGGVDSGATLDGGYQTVFAGGTADGAILNQNSRQFVSSGGIANATTLAETSWQFVSSGGAASGAVISAGWQEVSAGGTAIATTVDAGWAMVSDGGTLIDTVLSGGWIIGGPGGSVSGATVLGGLEVVSSGAVAFRSTVTGGSLGVAGGGTVNETTLVGGQMAVSAGGIASDTTVSGGSLVVGAGGTLIDATLAGGSASLSVGAAVGGTLRFRGDALLAISGGTMPGATLDGFGPFGIDGGSTIELVDVAFSSGATATLGAHNVLTVAEGGHSYALDFDPTQSFATDRFTLGADFMGGTDIQLQNVACFLAGTKLLTAHGEVPVENLAAGERVCTPASGGSAPIKWIGQRRIDIARHPRPDDVRPIRVRADAFGIGRPHRDLLLSPDHAIYVEGVLIPVRYLVNGATVVQTHVPTAHYFHIELPRHDIVLAEGLPTESYLDLGNRGAFAGGGAALALHPDFGRRVWEREACAELILGGPVLARVRARLLVQARLLGCDTPARLALPG